MKSTPLTPIHKSLGAKMVEYAGYLMPVSYEGIKEEHLAVRTDVGVFDVSHMGEFIVKGKEAFDLVQQITTNNVARLAVGDAQYSCMPNHEGGIIDDLLVYRLPEDKCAEGEQAYMLVVNAANIGKDRDWIEENNRFDAQLTDISDESGLLAIQGPKAIQVLQTLTDINLSEIEYYTFKKGKIAGIDNVIISATGYTGSGGFELYLSNKYLADLWNAIFEAGKDYNIQAAGLGARDTLRLEMGYCLYGNDIDDTTSPLEAGLGWITKTKKGDFTAVDIFKQQRVEGLSRKLVSFTLDDRRVPRKGYSIENEEGITIGEVTSGTQSPSLELPIGMGYVTKEYAIPDNLIYIVAGRKRLQAKIVKSPFYKK